MMAAGIKWEAPMGSFEWADLVTIGILVILEGILSGDNALVLAVMVLRLPDDQQRKALRYGILGALVLRAVATLLAASLIGLKWLSLVGGLYLLYLPYKHFAHRPDEERSPAARQARDGGRLPGLSTFWTTVIQVELTDLVFAVDSILVAVALTQETWVVITGGALGILMMRLLVIQVLALVKRYPKLIDGAYVVVLWVGIKLIWEYLHHLHWVPFAIPRGVAIGGVLALFVASFLYARAHEAKNAALAGAVDDAAALLTGREAGSPDVPQEGDGC
jgi:YkoY family integral membrane protein